MTSCAKPSRASEIRWDNRAFISLRVPEVSRAWAQLRTKDADALHCRFLGKPGQFNLNQIEKFGKSSPRCKRSSEGGSSGAAVPARQPPFALLSCSLVRDLLQQQLQGFRETFV